jgi:hypothetical protein
VRPLSPVRRTPAGVGSPDMVLTRLQSAFASLPFSTGSAPGFPGRLPYATGLTSYPSGYLGFAVGWRGFSAAPNRRFCELCQVRPLPELVRRLRAPPDGWSLLARLSRPAFEPVLARSSNRDPLGHCVSPPGRNSRLTSLGSDTVSIFRASPHSSNIRVLGGRDPAQRSW